MKAKQKALIFNFIGFAVIFLLARFGLAFISDIKPVYISILSAIIAMVVSPKFAVAQIKGKEKLMMKWIFIKEIKEL
ncbi:hypothetical protein J8L85_15050 [Maribacter sp. MMG018]|uniref:hypothetical protein n=1 Tax=Maribacter sp. MMG018 TaxID=2822688 RepID=UPI001B365FBD|nr:hypothetical protein [Maribacter sp. MMG018]MBQ4915771.1 hypothetical protein [Maribacter sp. MMG018]